MSGKTMDRLGFVDLQAYARPGDTLAVDQWSIEKCDGSESADRHSLIPFR